MNRGWYSWDLWHSAAGILALLDGSGRSWLPFEVPLVD
jgi:hypothetical protein